MINGEVGIGYLKFSDKISSGIEKGKTYVSTIGFNYGIGIEYKLNKHMGIGISFNGNHRFCIPEKHKDGKCT